MGQILQIYSEIDVEKWELFGVIVKPCVADDSHDSPPYDPCVISLDKLFIEVSGEMIQFSIEVSFLDSLSSGGCG